MEEILRPTVVIPDKDPVMIEKSEAIAALNVRLGNYNPKGGTGVRKVFGNLLLVNPLLPTGTNKVIGGTKDPNGRLLWLNWNSNGQHAIYCYDPAQPIPFQKVLEGAPLVGLTPTMKVSMDFDNGYLVWTSKDIEEPRQIDVARGINTFATPQGSPSYLLPIQPWETYQIQRVPKVPLAAAESSYQVYTFTPKPDVLSTDQGYQFAYNYEFINNIEGRLSPPTLPCWNRLNQLFYLNIPASEFPYLIKGSVSNSYVVAIRFYFRVGNGGEWTYFKRLLNNRPQGFNGEVFFSDFSILSAIGTPSLASLLGADGITRRVDDLLFADSRQVHSRLISGHTFKTPTATILTEYPNNTDTNIDSRGYMSFAPLNSQQIETALVFFDEQDRIIGGRINEPATLIRNDQAYIGLDSITAVDPNFFDVSRTWKELWDFQGAAFDQLDLFRNSVIRVTPDAITGGLPSPISKIMLATKPQKGYSGFLRTQCRVYAIYQNGSEIFRPFGDTSGESTTLSGETWKFYGIGFEFASSQPINFSTEQNYNIEVRGMTGGGGEPGAVNTANAFFRKTFKIVKQIGNLLIATPRYSQIGSLRFTFITTKSGDTNVQAYNAGNFSERVADIIIYSENKSDKPWQLVPSVNWTAAEWTALAAKYYVGDAYITKDEKTIEQSGTRDLIHRSSGSAQNFVNNFGIGLTPIICNGTFASMNLNGIYQENWDSNIGNTIAIDENPVEKNLLSFTRHGEQYLLGTQINNIFAFNPLNEDHTQSQLGPITKCVLLGIIDSNGNNLYYICENGVEMIFLGRTQQVGTDGNSVMSLSTKVFGSHNVLRLPYGAQNKFDVTTTDSGVVYYVDNRRKILVQISGNGQDPISVQKNFQSDMQLMADNTIIGFDPLYKEVVIDGGSQSRQLGLAYNMKDDSYQGLRDFIAYSNELFLWNSLGSNQKMFGFSQGNLYEYNVGYEFFGVPIPVEISMIVKANIDVLKRAGCIEIMSTANSPFFVELLSFTPLNNGAPNFTTISPSDFKLSEGNQFAVFKNSLNSKGGKFNGLPMHGYMYKLRLLALADSLEKQLSFIKVVMSEANTNQR